jgi:hypothetical protein
VTVTRARLDALCKVMEALLLGRIDAKSLALEVTSSDRFARLEAHVQALCQEFLRVTGRGARQPREGTS